MNSKSLSKKLIASLTGLLLALTVTPASQASVVYEQASTCGLSGAGTQSDPYLVWNVDELLQFEICSRGSGVVYFEQRTNIYLDSNQDFPSPDSSGGGFSYDGNGFAVTGLQSTTNFSSDSEEYGLFGQYSAPSGSTDFVKVEVKNLFVGFTDIIVSNATRTDSANVAALFSNLDDTEYLIENVVVKGGTLSGSRGTGGLISEAYNSNGTIKNSHVRVSSIIDVQGAIGGLLGTTQDNTGLHSFTVSDSSVESNLISSQVIAEGRTSRSKMGGFAGWISDVDVQIKRSRFLGSISSHKFTYNIGGAVGYVEEINSVPSLTFQDVVLDVNVSGGSIGGFIGDTYSPTAPVAVTIKDSIITGVMSLADEYYTDSSSAVLGYYGQDAALVMQDTVIDVDFVSTSSETDIGGGLISSREPDSRNISSSYFNSTKADNASWPAFTDHQAQSYWGLTPVASADMASTASFPGLSFQAPNGAASAGVFEICSGAARPFHSIEAAACNAPSISYPASLELGLWEFADESGIADFSHFNSFNITPALPEGLELNTVTGRITGHPQEVMQETTFTVTAVSNGGNVQDSFTLLVAANQVNLTYQSGIAGIADQVLVLDAGLVKLPGDLFRAGDPVLFGWTDLSDDSFYSVGATILLTSDTVLEAYRESSPDCSDDGLVFGDLKVLCDDSRGTITRAYGIDYSGLTRDSENIYFAGETDLFGNELWKSNGSPAGTEMLFDYSTRSSDTVWYIYHIEDNLLFFSDSSEYRLWVADLDTGERTELAESVDYFAGWFKGKLYFSKDTDEEGYELWATDGTVSGTGLVKDIYVGSDSSYPMSFVELDGLLYFDAGDADHGYELWETDGTSSGTKLTLDIKLGTDGSDPYPRGVFNNQLVLSADGTADTYGYYLFDPQTDQLTRLTTNYTGFYFSEVPGGFVFTSAASGRDINELWFSDGTLAGTSKIMDLRLAGEDAESAEFFTLDNHAYFTANDGTGESVYKTDGTANGTSKVFTNLSNPDLIGVVNGNLILSGDGTDGGKMMYYFEGENSFVPEPDSDNAPADSPSSGAAAPVGVSTGTPVITSQPVSISSSNESFEISGSNLRGVVVEVVDKPAFSRMNAAGNLEVIVPDLSAGVYDLAIIHSSGRLSISDYLIVTSEVESEAIDSAKPWTTMISDNEIKLYFKNPAGQGKVQFFHNGNEVAWVNAEDASDEKLRVISSGPMTGANYLVRTRELVEGKNVFEIYADGERVVRRAQGN